jgi:putative FmdB family regulatory protein
VGARHEAVPTGPGGTSSTIGTRGRAPAVLGHGCAPAVRNALVIGAVGPIYNLTFCIKGLAMPIYAYRCAECGHQKDVLQKLSDPALTTCPSCGAEAFSKQITAAGFQLKGSGWYATDFKGGASAGGAAAATSAGDSAPSDGGSSSGSTSTASAGAGPCGGSCACH